jgi:hypothetical protein
MTKKRKDLQPWLDHFKMLQTYERSGYLEVMPDKHEAFVTQTALLTLLGADETTLAEYLSDQRMLTATTDFLQRIRGYAGFKSQEGGQYLAANFALHIVKDVQPHDPVCTLLLTKKRDWLRREKEHIEVIGYER